MTDDVHGFVVDESDQVKTESEIMHVVLVSGSYFPMLGVKAQLGRMLKESDDTSEGDHPVAVISQSFWQRAFAGAPDILGRKLKVGSAFFSASALLRVSSSVQRSANHPTYGCRPA